MNIRIQKLPHTICIVCNIVQKKIRITLEAMSRELITDCLLFQPMKNNKKKWVNSSSPSWWLSHILWSERMRRLGDIWYLITLTVFCYTGPICQQENILLLQHTILFHIIKQLCQLLDERGSWTLTDSRQM